MILTDKMIKAAVEAGTVRLKPFDPKQVQPASYDLRVGEQGIATSGNAVVEVRRRGYFELSPGDFGILMTKELIEFDDRHTARIGLRSKYARKGIIATTGPQVDPGFRGRLKIGVTNLSPHVVTFPYDDDFITLEIHELSEAVETPYSGAYQGISDLSPEDIEAVTEGENIGFASMLESMRSISSNVSELTKSVERFASQNETIQSQYRYTLWIMGIGMGFIALLVALK